MKESWRWFGPQDPIPLTDVKQAGPAGIVTALHHLYSGQAWSPEDVQKRNAEIQAAGLVWSVVESIPVHNSIKLRSGPYRKFIGSWIDSLAAVAEAGVKVVCYNFMPVVDWTRTDLKWRLASGAYALRFDRNDFAAYDLFMLKRHGAAASYSEQQIDSARIHLDGMSEARRNDLEQTVIAGLPAAEASYDRESLRRSLAEYEGLSPEDLRAHLFAFLAEIVPVAEEKGVRLAIHPDDPPWSLFGLPRVVSTAEDARAILACSCLPANGLTFCVGSYGARADNDLLAMVSEFAPRIYFAHLRQVVREQDGSFYEAEHLAGSSDMAGVVHALLVEEARRREEGSLAEAIPMRPDHGHLLLSDQKKPSFPGYSMIGRLRGLAELRGLVHGIEYSMGRSKSISQGNGESGC